MCPYLWMVSLVVSNELAKSCRAVIIVLRFSSSRAAACLISSKAFSMFALVAWTCEYERRWEMLDEARGRLFGLVFWVLNRLESRERILLKV